MKFYFYSVFLTLSTTGVPAAMAADTVEVMSPVSQILIPDLFDDNDNVEIILKGEYPTACYQPADSGVTLDEATRTIHVWANSSLSTAPGILCQQVPTPFIQVVAVGSLPAGSYQVIYNHNHQISGSLTIEPAVSENPDNALYAPVEEVSIVESDDGLKLRLFGHYPYMLIGCMRFTEASMELAEDSLLIVYPLAEMINTRACNFIPEDHAFEILLPITEELPDEGVIHVRSLHGRSVNRLTHAPDYVN
jgi:hypothetical protein